MTTEQEKVSLANRAKALPAPDCAGECQGHHLADDEGPIGWLHHTAAGRKLETVVDGGPGLLHTIITLEDRGGRP